MQNIYKISLEFIKQKAKNNILPFVDLKSIMLP